MTRRAQEGLNIKRGVAETNHSQKRATESLNPHVRDHPRLDVSRSADAPFGAEATENIKFTKAKGFNRLADSLLVGGLSGQKSGKACRNMLTDIPIRAW